MNFLIISKIFGVLIFLTTFPSRCSDFTLKKYKFVGSCEFLNFLHFFLFCPLVRRCANFFLSFLSDLLFMFSRLPYSDNRLRHFHLKFSDIQMMFILKFAVIFGVLKTVIFTFILQSN